MVKDGVGAPLPHPLEIQKILLRADIVLPLPVKQRQTAADELRVIVRELTEGEVVALAALFAVEDVVCLKQRHIARACHLKAGVAVALAVAVQNGEVRPFLPQIVKDPAEDLLHIAAPGVAVVRGDVCDRSGGEVFTADTVGIGDHADRRADAPALVAVGVLHLHMRLVWLKKQRHILLKVDADEILRKYLIYKIQKFLVILRVKPCDRHRKASLLKIERAGVLRAGVKPGIRVKFARLGVQHAVRAVKLQHLLRDLEGYRRFLTRRERHMTPAF